MARNKYIKKRGVGRPSVTREIKDEVIDMYNDNVPNKHIADYFGISESSVYRIISNQIRLDSKDIADSLSVESCEILLYMADSMEVSLTDLVNMVVREYAESHCPKALSDLKL